VGQPERMSKLVAGHRHEVEAPSGDRNCDTPRFSLVEVDVAREVASVRRRVEAMGEDGAHAVERRTVAMIARHEANPNFRILAHRNL
jgi:hypothetical protein